MKKNIIVYTKTGCPWAASTIAFLDAKGVPYEERDILKNPAFKEEVEKATGQSKSPTLNIDGKWFPDSDPGQFAGEL